MLTELNEKKIINVSIGKITFYVNTKDLTSYLTIPLPQTVEKKPFGLQLFYNLNSEDVGQYANFGKGISFSYQHSFLDKSSEENSFYVTDVLGVKKTFVRENKTSSVYLNELNGEKLLVTSSEYILMDTNGTKITYKRKLQRLSKYETLNSFNFEHFTASGMLFKYSNDNCSVEFISNLSDKKITQINFKQITNKNSRTNYQVFLTYDSNNYLSQIEYKEGSTTLEKYTFTRTTSTVTIEDVLLHKKLVITTSGQTKTISSYVNNVFMGIQTISVSGSKTTLTDIEGKKTLYFYNNLNQLEYEVNENGWVRTHRYDRWNREIETSRTLQIFSHKTLSENLLENGNFSSDSLKYEVDGVTTFSDAIGTSTILDDKFVGKWLKLEPSSGKSKASISQTITKAGHKGDPFTVVLVGYREKLSFNCLYTFVVYFYDNLNQLVGKKKKADGFVLPNLYISTFSIEAPQEYSKIKVEIIFDGNQKFYMKELGLYEISIGKKVTYGYHGAIRKVQTGNEEVRTTMDQNNRLLSLTSSSFSGDLVQEYNDRNQPTKSVDIFGNTTEMEYDEDGEIISQRIQCVNVYSVSKRNISYSYDTITTKTTTEIDTRNQTSVEVIEINSNSLRSYLDPLSKKEEYGYNDYHDLIKVKESKDGTTLREQNITYNANRQIQKVVSGNGSQIEFDYNNYGLPDYIYVDDTNTQVEYYAYENDDKANQPKTGRISYKIYGDNDYIEEYGYNENGQLLYVDGDKVDENGFQREYAFTYDKKERLTHVYGTNNKLIKTYSYTPEDDISKIQITQGETIDIIRKENKEGYVVSRMTPNGEHSFEYNSQYDETTRRSPGAIINGVFQEFYSCFFTEKDPNSENYGTRLRKENEDGSMSNILNNGGLSDYISIQKKGRIPYYLVENNGNETLSYYLENKTDSIYVGCLYHFLENIDDEKNYRIIFGVRINDSDFITLEKKGVSLCLFKHNPLSSTLICNISSKLLKKEWNYLGVKLKKEETNTIISIIVNKNITSYTYNDSISLSENFSVSYAEQGSTLSVLYRAYGWYTNLMVANTDFSLEDICRYIDGLYHNLLEVEKEGSTWKQEAVQTKHTVLGIKETSGLTNWDYFPLSGSVTSVKGNRDVKLTPKEEYYKANNSYYSYDETLRQEVFDAGKCMLCKTIDFPFESGKANILFDFKVLESETTNDFNILATEGLKIFVKKDDINENQYYVYYNFGNSNDTNTYLKITKGTWNKFQLGLSRENGMIRMYLIINNSRFVNYQSNSLYSKLNITPAKNTNCLLANFLYGEGEYSKYESLLKRIRETTETDRLGRVLSTEIEDNGKVVLKKTYTYEDRTVTENGSTETRTSGIISKEVDTYGDNEVTNVYTFDALGRMTSQTHGIAISGIFYSYDDRGFLQEENYSFRQRDAYEYDNNGNIKTIKYYKNSTTVIPNTITRFTYGTLYKDRLESVGTDVLEYEETNPLYVKRIYNSSTQVEKMKFSWRGSRLIKLIVDGEYAIQYEYNDDGTRRRKLIKETKTENGTSKTIDDIIYSYVGGQLQSETHSKGYQLQYFYGLDGRLSFFIYRKDNVETRYYYRWDLLGITGIIDRDGNEVANYSYDAFGNIRSTHEDDSIGAINPMRYKGYYYDSETKYYWLNSRFYVPSWRRFLSPKNIDDLHLESINEINLFIFISNIVQKSVNAQCMNLKPVSSLKSVRSIKNVTGSHIAGLPKSFFKVLMHNTHTIYQNVMFSFTHSQTIEMNETNGVYLFTDTGNDGSNAGIEIDVSKKLGISVSLSKNSFNLNFQLNSLISLNLGIGKDGISLGIGIKTENEINEFTLTIHPMAILTFAIAASIIFLIAASAVKTAALATNPVFAIGYVIFLFLFINNKKNKTYSF